MRRGSRRSASRLQRLLNCCSLLRGGPGRSSVYVAMNVPTGVIISSGIASRSLRWLWNVVRAPILGLLMLCEPVVRWLCVTIMVLGVFVSVLFEISAAGPRFPFLGMIGASLGFGVLLVLYYGLMSLLIE